MKERYKNLLFLLPALCVGVFAAVGMQSGQPVLSEAVCLTETTEAVMVAEQKQRPEAGADAETEIAEAAAGTEITKATETGTETEEITEADTESKETETTEKNSSSETSEKSEKTKNKKEKKNTKKNRKYGKSGEYRKYGKRKNLGYERRRLHRFHHSIRGRIRGFCGLHAHGGRYDQKRETGKNR